MAEDDNLLAVLAERVKNLSDRLKERDRVLFGDDGRGGLVADMNRNNLQWKVLLAIVTLIIIPLLVYLVADTIVGG